MQTVLPVPNSSVQAPTNKVNKTLSAIQSNNRNPTRGTAPALASDIPNNADGQIEGKAVASSTDTVGRVSEHWSSSLEFLTALARDPSDPFHTFLPTSPPGATIGTCDVIRDAENLDTGVQSHTETIYNVVIGIENTNLVTAGGEVLLLGDGTADVFFKVGPDSTHCVGNLVKNSVPIKVQSNGDFTFNGDASLSSSDSNYQDNWDVIIHPINQPPIASADISNTILTPGEHVKLFGTASDPENGPLTYSWGQGSGTPVQWSTAQNILQPEFVVPPFDKNNDLNNQLSFGFSATDDHGLQAVATTPTARVIPLNHPPVAVVQILPSDVVNPGTVVTLDASKSNDPDPEDHIKSFFWEQTAGPAVTLNSTSSPIIHFIPFDIVQDTTLKFTLTLIDSNPIPSISITPVNVLVHPPPPPVCTLSTTSAITPSNNNNNVAPTSQSSSATSCVHIDVQVDKPVVSPLASNPFSTITVTATKADGSPAPNEDILVKACTIPGGGASPSGDGHISDTRADACDPSVVNLPYFPARPTANMKYNGAVYHDTNVNPISATTDASGKITIQYTSPCVFNNDQCLQPPPPPQPDRRHFISGDDKIIATLKADISITGESSIITKVNNLEPMPGSDTCTGLASGGGGTYSFDSQNNHACRFYGTARDNGMMACDSIKHPGVNCTNDAILAIANEFSDRQIECRAPHPPTPDCLATLDDGVTTEPINLPHNSEPIPIIITAMSLPWGGLNDIGPKLNNNGACVLDCTLVLWHTPHQTHHNGKEVDITVRNLDRHHKLLLRQVILDNHYGDFSSLARCEGATSQAFPGLGNLVTNVQACILTTGQASHGQATHIHVNFAN